jgi:hypothetical protein
MMVEASLAAHAVIPSEARDLAREWFELEPARSLAEFTLSLPKGSG